MGRVGDRVIDDAGPASHINAMNIGSGDDRSGHRQRHGAVGLLVLIVAGLLFSVVGTPSAQAQGSRPHKRGSGLVGYPSYLPKSTLHFHTDTTVVGTIERPALTNQGDRVKVVTRHWSVLAVVNGPQVPGEGLPYQAPTTTCTWTITLSRATGRVPVVASDFDSIDQQGNVYRQYLVPGQPEPPRVLEPGHRVTFELQGAEAVGEGLMRWAPIGGHIVAKWDFVVEND